MTIEQLYEIYQQHPVVTTDSRNCPVGSIFFALKGDNFNGNRFAAAALEQGCAYAVVDEESEELGVRSEELGARIILVDDVLTTLQQLAHFHRLHFRGPVLQITGTNGKTTTKELVSTVLAQKYNVLFTQGNLNNHIGVPRTLLRLTADHDIAVIETGANHPGEIKTLAEIVAPDCGLITNVGVAHIEGFGSFEGVVKTKGELYDFLRSKEEMSKGSKEERSKGLDAAPFIFLNADNEHLRKIAHGLPAVSYGSMGHGYDVEGEVVECAPFLKLRWRSKLNDQPQTANGQCSTVNGQCSTVNGQWSMVNGQCSMVNEVQTHLIGAYNIDNVLAAVSVGLRFGVEPAQINAALAGYVPTNNRSEMRKTARNTLIVDAYNANPSSMAAALQNFAMMQAPEGMRKMLILGEMRELGDISEREHARVVEKIKSECPGLSAESVWLVGENFQRLNPPFPTFKDVEEVKARLGEAPVENRLILIKGSNGTRLFQLPDCL